MELILVNDESTDATEDVIDAYEPHFTSHGAMYHKINQPNTGLGGAIAAALARVSGEFFVWQDPDDFFEPDALEKLRNYLKTHHDIAFVRGEVNVRNLNDPDKIVKVGKSQFPFTRDICEDLVVHRDMYCFAGCFMGRFATFLQFNQGNKIYPSRVGQNVQLLLPLAVASSCGYLPEVVFNYIVRSDSLSHTQISIEQKLSRYQEYKRIFQSTISRVAIPQQKKNHLLSLANRRLSAKIRHLRFKLLIQKLTPAKKI